MHLSRLRDRRPSGDDTSVTQKEIQLGSGNGGVVLSSVNVCQSQFLGFTASRRTTEPRSWVTYAAEAFPANGTPDSTKTQLGVGMDGASHKAATLSKVLGLFDTAVSCWKQEFPVYWRFLCGEPGSPLGWRRALAVGSVC
jgi:hypothetical protein